MPLYRLLQQPLVPRQLRPPLGPPVQQEVPGLVLPHEDGLPAAVHPRARAEDAAGSDQHVCRVHGELAVVLEVGRQRGACGEAVLRGPDQRGVERRHPASPDPSAAGDEPGVPGVHRAGGGALPGLRHPVHLLPAVLAPVVREAPVQHAEGGAAAAVPQLAGDDGGRGPGGLHRDVRNGEAGARLAGDVHQVHLGGPRGPAVADAPEDHHLGPPLGAVGRS